MKYTLRSLLVTALISMIASSSLFSTAPTKTTSAFSESHEGSWVVDGRGVEPFWQRSKSLDFEPAAPGVPLSLGGTVRVVVEEGYLGLLATLPEPDGKVVARSIGFNPTWERYALTSPPVEDRIHFEIRNVDPRSLVSVLDIAVNPWGALRVERDSRLVGETGIVVAADITQEGWTVELAVPLNDIFPAGEAGEIDLLATRARSRRPLSPQFDWTTEPEKLGISDGLDVRVGKRPAQSPRKWQQPGPVLEVGRVQKVPPLDMAWDGPFWRSIPGLELLRNEPAPRGAVYPTLVKWVHDGETLQVQFENEEHGRLDVDVDTRDGNVGSDDHVAVYLALTGSSTVVVMANPVGAIRDAKSAGPRAFGLSAGAFDAGITGNFVKEKGRWMARLNLPLAEIAAALGGKGVPRNWKVLVGRVRQERPGEPAEISTIPVLGSAFLNAPARFRGLRLSELPPSEIEKADPQVASGPADPMADQLKSLSPYAMTRVQRAYHDVTNMLFNKIDSRTKELAMQEHEEWDQVETLQDWEAYRERRMPVLLGALGEPPAKKCELNYQQSSVYRGDGYQIRNIAYQSRPGFYIAANLYLPAEPPDKMPGMILLPAHHYPKTHGEMKDCGMVWARSGVAVLIMEHIGFGERLETSPLYRQAYESEYLLSQQLELVGQSLQGWIVYDVARTVDLFEELGAIDMDRVLLVGSVTWGGGRRAAPAGLLDERIDGQIIYNFGRVYWYGWGTRDLVNNLITPWFVVSAFAPRKLVYAHEFWYEGEEGPGYPEVWVPAWPRYEKVYGFYGKRSNLATAQGEGLLRAGATEFIPRGDCYMLGSVQRRSLYPILERWFDIPLPSRADQEIPLDSGLSDARRRPDFPVIKYKESIRRPSDDAVLSIPPATSEVLERVPLHSIAHGMGEELLAAARIRRGTLSGEQRLSSLREELADLLGDIEPETRSRVVYRDKMTTGDVEVEPVTLETEDGILVPLMLLKAKSEGEARLPVVLALSEGGKSRFLRERTSELAYCLKNGYLVCVPDVRGTGETAFSQYNRGDEPALSLAELGESLLGGRLKDVRTVLQYLRSRADIVADDVRIWGDSFAPVNSDPIWVDELLGKPVSPQIQHLASPLGAHLALLTALYESDISAVAVRGGLISYLSLLNSNFLYVPPDISVSRLLEVADVVDIAAVLNPVPLRYSAPVDGRNYLATLAEINQEFELALQAYGSGSELVLEAGTPGQAGQLVEWLITR